MTAHRAPRRALALAAALAAALPLLAACSSSDSDATSTATASGDISAERCAENQAAGAITFLTSYQYTATVGILDVLAAEQQGYFADLCLDVTIQPGGTNAQLVSAGTAQIAGLGGASDVMTAVDNGADITGVATYGNTVAITLMTNADSGIDSLDDFVGKTIGYKDAIPPQVEAMFVQAGIALDSINWVSVGYDPTILPQGQVDALTGYISNEPHTLETAGYDVTLWNPSDYGIESTFNTQIVNTDWAEANPTAVEDFLRASLHGYDYLNTSDDNLASTLDYASSLSDSGYDVDAASYRWTTEVGLVEDSLPDGWGVGQESVDQWQPEADMLVTYDLVKSTPDPASDLDSSYIDAIYDTDGTLIWPAP
ncbi:MAG: ABC transporter substrate-binding protein [Microbacteriaceae bacterium]